jgi:hypothetical protein
MQDSTAATHRSKRPLPAQATTARTHSPACSRRRLYHAQPHREAELPLHAVLHATPPGTFPLSPALPDAVFLGCLMLDVVSTRMLRLGDPSGLHGFRVGPLLATLLAACGWPLRQAPPLSCACRSIGVRSWTWRDAALQRFDALLLPPLLHAEGSTLAPDDAFSV